MDLSAEASFLYQNILESSTFDYNEYSENKGVHLKGEILQLETNSHSLQIITQESTTS